MVDIEVVLPSTELEDIEDGEEVTVLDDETLIAPT